MIPLPARTEKFLAGLVREGSRNEEAFAAACQLRDAGLTQADAERRIIAGAAACGLPRREALNAVASAFTKNKRQAIGGRPVLLKYNRHVKGIRLLPTLPPKPAPRSIRTWNCNASSIVIPSLEENACSDASDGIF
jgi:hypothetical protein